MQHSTLQMPGLSLRPPQQPAMGSGFIVALAAHALLLLALTLNVQWHSATPEAFEAELWSAVPQAAAPAAAEPEVEPPKPVVEDKPKPQEPSAEELQAQREAEIAIAKAKKRAEEKKEEQRLAEIREKELKAKQLKEKQEREKQLAKEKAEKAEKQEKQDKLDKAKQQEKLQKDKAAKEAEARQENARKDALRRLQGLAGGTGAADATGTAQQSSGPSAGYAGRIKAKIRPNIVFDVGATNPVAEVEVRVAPDGRIISKRLLKPSGDAEWDRAVERAIDKTEILPRDTDGRVPPVIVLSLRPRE